MRMRGVLMCLVMVRSLWRRTEIDQSCNHTAALSSFPASNTTYVHAVLTHLALWAKREQGRGERKEFKRSTCILYRYQRVIQDQNSYLFITADVICVCSLRNK